MPAQALTSNIHDVALVFEGGGMRESHSAGVVRVLLENELYFDWMAGISAGGSSCANFISRDAARARKNFVEIVDDPLFGGWRTFVRGQGMFNAEYLYEQTGDPGQVLEYDWDAYVANDARMEVGAFHCESGRTVYFTRDDMATYQDMAVRLRASATMPGLMPTTTIDGEDYVDGAVGTSGGIPLDAAQAAGYEKFFVVLTRPAGYRKAPAKLPTAYRRLFRRYPKVAEGLLARADNYNRTLDELEDLERQGRAYVFRPQHMIVNNQERDRDRLAASYAAGVVQSLDELPRWLEFVGR